MTVLGIFKLEFLLNIQGSLVGLETCLLNKMPIFIEVGPSFNDDLCFFLGFFRENYNDLS